jgi:glucose/mannose transport system substrate-binding protein
MTMTRRLQMSAAVLALSTSVAAAQGVEVLHWWTSGGEAAALNVLKQDLEGQGVGWTDMPVAGGGGSDAMTVLRARVTAGNHRPPCRCSASRSRTGLPRARSANLNELAAEQNWGDVVPEALQRFSTYDGNWVSAPVNVHSTNWVWANTALMEELGIEQPETGTSSSPRWKRPRPPATSPSPMVARPGRTPRSSNRW